MTMPRPTRAIFCGDAALDSKDRILAIAPEALGASYRTVDPWEERYQGERLDSMLEETDGVAIVSIEGPLEHHRNWCWESYDGILSAVTRAMGHEECKAIVLELDSPGGDVSGCFETVKAMRAMSAERGKPIFAYVNEAAYSAAYALACSASEIYLPRSGGVGSVGVIATLCDRTKMTAKLGLRIEVIKSGARKAYGHPDVPLSDDAIAAMQERVDDLAAQFFQVVSASRGIKFKAVQAFQAGTFHGDEAVTKKLADGVMSFADVVSAAQSYVGSQPKPAKPKAARQGETAMNLLALKKKVTDARAALNAARSLKAKTAAIAKLKAAIATFNTELTAAKKRGDVNAKTVKKEKYEKVEETDDEEGAEDAEDAEEDAEDAEEDAEEAEDAEDADGDGDDDEGDDDDEEDDDEDAEEAAAATNATELLASVTGTRNLAKQRGVLMAMQESHKKVAKLDAQVAALTRESKRAKVENLIAKGQKDGKLSPGMLAWARETGMKSPSTLRAYIKSAPKIHALEESPAGRNPNQGGGGAGGNPALGLSAAEVTIATNMGISLEAFAKQKASKAQNGSLRH
jgi:signal peptide peptidase SppA